MFSFDPFDCAIHTFDIIVVICSIFNNVALKICRIALKKAGFILFYYREVALKKLFPNLSFL